MIYHPRTPQEAVNLRKEHADTAVYLAGGTDDLRLGGAAGAGVGGCQQPQHFFLGHLIETSVFWVNSS